MSTGDGLVQQDRGALRASRRVRANAPAATDGASSDTKERQRRHSRPRVLMVAESDGQRSHRVVFGADRLSAPVVARGLWHNRPNLHDYYNHWIPHHIGDRRCSSPAEQALLHLGVAWLFDRYRFGVYWRRVGPRFGATRRPTVRYPRNFRARASDGGRHAARRTVHDPADCPPRLAKFPAASGDRHGGNRGGTDTVGLAGLVWNGRVQFCR